MNISKMITKMLVSIILGLSLILLAIGAAFLLYRYPEAMLYCAGIFATFIISALIYQTIR